ncbi:uncharacterized protein [Nicotiana sylvestris]|uniref:Uncharacterized protein LOC104236860 n=1 Tax=Nicotiana sylvestris TaxID=4096 RepID=A0A1U7XAQ6_NICSY|nr:PREDICTED: uncharacterized protein LOC104236860 [Nicotiana sylvestris]
MDAIQQVGFPVLGIIAAAAVTFYVVSFSEIREKSFREFEDAEESESGGFKYVSSRERRARRKADKQKPNKS